MSTPRYIREYLTAHPDAHRDEVIDRLGYDFEHETVRGPVYDSWGESVMDEHNCLELREELQELLASFKTEDSKAAYEIARLGLNPQQLTEYRTSISSFVTSCLDAYEPKLTDFIVEAVDPEEEVRPAGSLRVQFLDGYGDRLVGTYVRLAPAAANSSPDQPLRMELSREMVIENSEGYESPDMLPSVPSRRAAALVDALRPNQRGSNRCDRGAFIGTRGGKRAGNSRDAAASLRRPRRCRRPRRTNAGLGGSLPRKLPGLSARRQLNARRRSQHGAAAPSHR